ncbi:MAG TPA: radical SAM family heme chaperone HemW [Gemmatimonadaceae bacterium]|nr:radical SAM family heme chaperone HemW [Gemmatimonadaceae bacterium]
MHLYVHVPFCARRCSYCDFAIAVRRRVPARAFVDGVAREMATRDLGGAELDTVYLGGGTPSKLGADGVAQLLDAIRGRFTIARDAEVTIEANPEDIAVPAVKSWRDTGVNRVSLGAQSFDDAVLKWMHRTHDAKQIGRAVRDVRESGVENVSIDLIFALPDALRRDWTRDLDSAIALEPQHVSLYGLTVEPATPVGRWTARGEMHEAPDERWAAEFVIAHDTLFRAGYAHYEVSNYARNNARARHNSAYWGDRSYIGVGPSAHGFNGSVRRWNESAYARWIAKVDAGSDPIGGSESLTPEQRAAERVYLGLRSDAGLDVSNAGRDALRVVQQWVTAGWAEFGGHDSRTLRLTVQGWMRLDALASALTTIRSHY